MMSTATRWVTAEKPCLAIRTIMMNMAIRGHSREGVFGTVHYDESGHRAGHSYQGLLGYENHYDNMGHKVGYRDTSKISKYNMVAFLKANTTYEMKQSFQNTCAETRVIVGGKEQKKMLRSAELLHKMLPGSRLEMKDGLYHGEYSINQPEQYTKELLEMIIQ